MASLEWAKRPLRKYATFTGRAPRPEYWWFCLFSVLAILLALAFDSMTGMAAFGPDSLYGPAALLLSFGLLIPSLAVSVRRLHDTNRAGWWWFIGLIPLVGSIVLLIFFVSRGTSGDNRYGSEVTSPSDP